MTSVNVKVRITVDPAGRVIVWENERTLPSDRIKVDGYERDYSGCWHAQPGATSYYVDVTLPLPPLDEPTARIVTVFPDTKKHPLRVTVNRDGGVDSNG